MKHKNAIPWVVFVLTCSVAVLSFAAILWCRRIHPAPHSPSIRLCNIYLPEPKFVTSEFKQDDNFFRSVEGQLACKYDAGSLDVIILRKNLPTSSTYWVGKFQAYEEYKTTSDAGQIPNLSMPYVYGSIQPESVYQKLSDDRGQFKGVGYTAIVLYDRETPGTGVYQIATEPDSSTLVFLTYTLFDRNDKQWAEYFKSHYPSNLSYLDDVYMSYMNLRLGNQTTNREIQEINDNALQIH